MTARVLEPQRSVSPRQTSAVASLMLFLPLLLATVLTVPGLYLWFPLLIALVAAHHWGMRAGLAALALLSLPALWHDEFWYPAASLGAFAAAHVGRRWNWMAYEATALYCLVASVLFALFYSLFTPASSWMLALAPLQVLMSAIPLAAIADVLNVNFVLKRQRPFVAFNPHLSVLRLLRAASNPLLIIFIIIPAVNQLVALTGLEGAYRARIDAAALARIAPKIAAGQMSGEGEFRLVAQPRKTLFFYHESGSVLPEMLSARRDEACIAAGTPTLGGSVLGPCDAVHAKIAGRPLEMTLVYTAFDRGVLPKRYGELMLLLTGALLAWLYRSILSHALRVTFAQADRLIDQFGKHELIGLPLPPVREMEEPLGRLVVLNNASVALRIERERLAEVAADLNRTIGLKLMRDVWFDADEGVLSYTEVRLVGDPTHSIMQVHPDDCAQFKMAAGIEEVVIEFRPATASDFECLLVTLHDGPGGLHWSSGVMVQLKRPRHLDNIIANQARLADLGNVASSIGHEIKQPLFTIAVAAESLRLLATKGQSGLIDPQILGRIDRISEQVGRARDIIEHVTRYGKQTQTQSVAIDVTETMRRALSFLMPLLDDQHIDVHMAIDEGPLWAIMSQVELEQVFVNAIQNAIDSIVARGRSGWTGQGVIDLRVTSDATMISSAIADNGMGLAPSVAQSAFSAFFTTKADQGTGLGLYISRQIIERARGRIALGPHSDGGAILEIELPRTTELPA